METSTKSSSNPHIHSDYIFHHYPRTDNICGGGVGIMIRKFYQTVILKEINLNYSQCIRVKIISGYTFRNKGSLNENFSPKNPMILAWGFFGIIKSR